MIIKSRFARGMLVTFGTNLAQLVIGVVTSILTARLLGPDNLGRYSLALLFAVVVITFSNLGFAPATTYYVSRRSRPLGDVVINSVVASMGLGLLGFIGGAVVARLWGNYVLRGVPLIVSIVALLIVPLTLLAGNLRAVLQGEQRFRAYNAALIGDALLRGILIGSLWLIGGGLLAAVASNVVATGVVAIILLVSLVRRAPGGTVSRAYLGESFAYGSKAYLGNAIQFLNYRVDMLLLNGLHGAAAVGFYSVAVVFAERLRMISGAASTVLFPQVAAAHAGTAPKFDTPAVCRVVLWSSTVAALLFWLFSRWIVTLLYSKVYAAAVLPLQILLVGIVVQSAAEVVANDFAGRGMPLVNTTIAGITLALNIALLVAFVPRYGAAGAAFATTISYAAQGVATIAWYVRISGERLSLMILPQRDDLSRMLRLIHGRPPASLIGPA